MEPGRSAFFFSRRAHLLTTSSSQAPYPSPRRKAAGLAHSAAPPLPTKSLGLCGAPFRRWTAALRQARALRGGWRSRFRPKSRLTAVGLRHARLRASVRERQTMLPRLRSRSALPARRDRCSDSSACENLHTGSFFAEAGTDRFARPCVLFATKRNRKGNYGGESDWRYTTWKRSL